MDKYNAQTVALLEQALHRMEQYTPLASLSLLQKLQDVVELAKIELDSEDE